MRTKRLYLIGKGSYILRFVHNRKCWARVGKALREARDLIEGQDVEVA